MNTATEQLRQTAAKTAGPSKAAFHPTRVFVDKDRTAFLWFCVAVFAVLFAAAQPYYFINQFKQSL